MNRDEAVLKLIKIARISEAYAEDLYNSFFPKPVVPQYVADWYEKHKDGYDYELWDYFSNWDRQEDDDFKEWIREDKNQPILTLVSMHQFGYEVEKEARYTVSIKAITDGDNFLKKDKHDNVWYFGGSRDIGILHHTRKELEEAGFGWIFSCEGVEVKEVGDRND